MSDPPSETDSDLASNVVFLCKTGIVVLRPWSSRHSGYTHWLPLSALASLPRAVEAPVAVLHEIAPSQLTDGKPLALGAEDEPDPALEWIPLTAADVPPGAIIKGCADKIGWLAVLACNDAGLFHTGPDFTLVFEEWKELARDNMQISRDFGVTWSPCRKSKEPQTEPAKDSRAEFEAWLTGVRGGRVGMDRESGGDYIDNIAHFHWQGWRAARGEGV